MGLSQRQGSSRTGNNNEDTAVEINTTHSPFFLFVSRPVTVEKAYSYAEYENVLNTPS